MRIRLQILDDQHSSRFFEHADSAFVIGRDPASMLSFAGNSRVSWRHAQIDFAQSAVLLRDLGSSNGTFVNNCRVDGHSHLRRGDLIRLGHTGPTMKVIDVQTSDGSAERVSGTIREPVAPARASMVASVAPVHDGASSAPVGHVMARPEERAAPSPREPGLNTMRFMVGSLRARQRGILITIVVVFTLLLVVVAGAFVYLYRFQRDDDAIRRELDQAGVSLASKIRKKYGDAVYLVAEWSGRERSKVKAIGTAFAVDENGRLGTNGHIAIPVIKFLKEKKKIWVISSGGKHAFKVTKAIPHPKYKHFVSGKIQFQTPDVGVLFVDLAGEDKLPKVVKLASRRELKKLEHGARVGFIGFPVWQRKDYASTDAVEPRVDEGEINRLTTFRGTTGGFEDLFLLEHDLKTTGGASGSPIFNRKEKVVAVHNSGLSIRTPGMSIPVGPGKGIRVDLLVELLGQD